MAIKFGDSGSITLKAVTVGALVLLLLLPLSMLRGLVGERSARRETAYEKVAQGWGGSITVGGPMLIVPTQQLLRENDETRVVRTDLYLLPSRLDAKIEVTLQDEPRHVGIYSVPVYLANVHLAGEFEPSALQSLLGKPGVTYLWGESRLRLPLSHVRSLREVTGASFADQTLELGPAGPGVYGGIEATVDLSALMQRPSLGFEFRTVVAGSRGFSMLPLGSVTTLQLQSNWPHPSFGGAFLPADYDITADGFSARWQVLELNRPYRQAWAEHEVSEGALNESALSVDLHQPVDVYQRAERAAKYAALFIALTFLTFFAWEQVARVRLHPLQYLLVGLALSTFYLLLIALSEHVAFAIAYVLAAIALVLLIGIYIAGALRGSARGLIAAAAMSATYGLLYVLVLSEDYALLLGAIVLFAALAAVMLVTRRIDWYRINSEPSLRNEAAQP